MARRATVALSQQLRDAIDASGMSRYRICKEIGLAESTMSRFMAGRRGLALTTVDRLGEVLGLRLVADGSPQAKQRDRGR
jgi:plasmid maintenance system antidote protein VapI